MTTQVPPAQNPTFKGIVLSHWLFSGSTNNRTQHPPCIFPSWQWPLTLLIILCHKNVPTATSYIFRYVPAPLLRKVTPHSKPYRLPWISWMLSSCEVGLWLYFWCTAIPGSPILKTIIIDQSLHGQSNCYLCNTLISSGDVGQTSNLFHWSICPQCINTIFTKAAW